MFVKRFLSILMFLGLLLETYASDEQDVTLGLAAIKKFENVWIKTLIRKFKEDSSGVVAVKYCSENAQKITNEINEQLTNVTLKRTSLKFRNSLNQPDNIDLPVLKEFDETSSSGRDVEIKIVNTGDGIIKVYKPLVITQPLCLKCHGAKNRVHPEIIEILNQKYPDDKAINFKYKNVRGAIVATIKN